MRVLGLALLLVGCGPPDAPAASRLATNGSPATSAAPAAPPGTVLLVDELALTAGEVEPLAADVGALYPEYTPIYRRRLALTNEFLPRLAAHASASERWAAARAACTAADPSQLPAARDQGNFKRLGLGFWSAARHLAAGEWSGPLELPGRWLRVRLEALEPNLDPREEILHVAWIEFPYLERAQAFALIEQALDHARLTLVDPAWNDVVPESWKYRMRGSKP